MKSLLKKIVTKTLEAEARLVLKKYHPRIIAVTGSVGKTSTKDAIFAMLAPTEHVRCSDKSFNSEIGLPLTILGRPNAWNNPLRWLENILDGLFLILIHAQYPDWLVLEVGADRPGDISSLASWLSVDIAVITRLPEVPVHVEFFDSPEAVVQEKASLINALKPEGVLVAYADDARAAMLQERATARGVHTVLFGTSAHAEVRGTAFASTHAHTNAPVRSEWPTGMSMQILAHGHHASLEVAGVLGVPGLLSLVGAAAVGVALGKNIEEIVTGLTHYEPPRGRMRLIPGLKDSLIIDDTYNASPAAVVAALDALSSVQHAMRKIAVVGDMLELGRLSVEQHRKVGAYAAPLVDLLITVGFRARDIAEGALSNGLSDAQILQYEDATRVGEELQAMLEKGDCVLVKGSQSMRMERIVERLMAEPEKAAELLVRQERDWKKR